MGEKSIQQMSYSDFRFYVDNHADRRAFEQFVKDVSPEGKVQQVWVDTALIILKLLWEIFQLLKGSGLLDKFWAWIATLRTRRAMKKDTQTSQELALRQIIADYSN